MTGITSTRLADGRELIYFDDAGSRLAASRAREAAPDRRELPGARSREKSASMR